MTKKGTNKIPATLESVPTMKEYQDYKVNVKESS